MENQAEPTAYQDTLLLNCPPLANQTMLKILQTDPITLDSSASGGTCSVGMRKQGSSDRTQIVILGTGSTLLEVQCLGIRCRYSILVPSNMAVGVS